MSEKVETSLFRLLVPILGFFMSYTMYNMDKKQDKLISDVTQLLIANGKQEGEIQRLKDDIKDIQSKKSKDCPEQATKIHIVGTKPEDEYSYVKQKSKKTT